MTETLVHAGVKGMKWKNKRASLLPDPNGDQKAQAAKILGLKPGQKLPENWKVLIIKMAEKAKAKKAKASKNQGAKDAAAKTLGLKPGDKLPENWKNLVAKANKSKAAKGKKRVAKALAEKKKAKG